MALGATAQMIASLHAGIACRSVFVISLAFCFDCADVAAQAGSAKCEAGADGVCNAEMSAVDLAAAEPFQTISVVLPCAEEREFAVNTVRSVYEMTPKEVLLEIIVVDDGSRPPLTKKLLTKKVREKYGVRVLRHSTTEGLIISKKDGGDAAQGDIVVFFDCHVAPQLDWYKEFLKLISENYRRVVVPVITDLDIDTWTQTQASAGNKKCYLSWDADFKWFESDDDIVPVLSGGLLGMSKRWWNETGGYDEQMQGWGGENIDQSLRTWLCGGEIINARGSFVAHMWRKDDDPRTNRRYRVGGGSVVKNKVRAAVSWYGPFQEKLRDFPYFQVDRRTWEGSPWYGSIENVLDVSRRLQCKPLVWYLHRFENIYTHAGVMPKKTFSLRVGDKTGPCLTYLGHPGTNMEGRGEAVLQKCRKDAWEQRWHVSNRDLSKPDQPCCSGLRAWNTDMCIEGVSDGKVQLYACAIAGHHHMQQWRFSDGRLKRGFLVWQAKRNECILANADAKTLELGPCSGTKWTKFATSEPIEHKLYQQELKHLQLKE